MDLPMSSDPVVLKIDGVSKHYQVYGSPQDRLKDALFRALRVSWEAEANPMAASSVR